MLAGMAWANWPSAAHALVEAGWAKAGEGCGAARLTSLADLEISEKAGIDILLEGGGPRI